MVVFLSSLAMQYISCLDEMASHHAPQETVAQGGTGCASNCGSCSDRCVSNFADLWRSDQDGKEAEGWDQRSSSCVVRSPSNAALQRIDEGMVRDGARTISLNKIQRARRLEDDTDVIHPPRTLVWNLT
jgi:hypothetical protein